MSEELVLEGQVNGEATDTGTSVVLELEVKFESTSGNDGDIDVIVEAVLRSGEDFLLSELNGSGIDNNATSLNTKLEASDSDIILDVTASVHRVIFIELRFFGKSDGGWLPWVISTRAAGPLGSKVSDGQSEDEGDKDDGFHERGKEGNKIVLGK